MNSIRTLLAGIVDYAGLFPPATLDMSTAVRNYAAYRHGEDPWMLGRFIVPVSRLAEFEEAIQVIARRGGEPWRLSALGGDTLKEDGIAIMAFNKRQTDQRGEGLAVIDTLEVKTSTIKEVESAARLAPSSLATYFEVPVEPDPSPLIEAISEVGARAKVRTGGVTPDAFPSSTSLARFICACADAGVPFKATAGLHHPIRSTYRLTYDPTSPMGMMFGFLNVLFAAGVALAGGHPDDVVAVLEEQSLSAFHFEGNEITWRGHRIGLLQIGLVRSELAIAFGSCSFTEPLGELKSLNLL